MADWKETKLWLLLKAKPVEEAKTVQTMLEACMPNIQDILARGGTSPNDFTLHDAEHSFRVAQRMVDITPEDVHSQLSTYELALLLLSAYLHDIGMTPERQKVRQHYLFLLTGEADKPDSLTQAEQNEFQAWMDDEGDGVVPPLATHSPTGEVLRRAEEIITYYARHKHNDWSGEWIEAHRDWFKGAYVSFTDDLIRVCKSHHYGYKELVLDQFNPHNVGSSTVHLRYLAVLLRLADILEFDPERTPEVVLRHRDIAPKSLIYWYKDHEVSITQDGNRLVAYARPREARMHRAIELMLDDIEKELRVCRTLADETHFENSPGIQEKLPHRWDLSGTLHREDVKPQNNRYEYINGAFRPDTRKILELLSGIELYGSPFVAVRELLQNAFDAVREQIAYQRLDLPDPNDANAVNALETLCNVMLKLEESEDGFWLVCTDNGVGMTKDIINRYLLVSGSARRHEILDLERRCKAQGFTLGRTGQFGIGVLSYFMLADKLELRTRRSQEAGSAEQTGWHFTTEGIGSFGELRRDTEVRRGTQIRLHLKKEIIGNDPAQWYAGLRNYLVETLCYLPCKFHFETNIPSCEPFSSSSGWIDIRDILTNIVIDGVPEASSQYVSFDLLPPSQQNRLVEEDKELDLIRQEARQCLRFYVVTDNLPNGMGRYRLHIVHFQLPGGVALGYLRVRGNSDNLSFVKPDFGHFLIWDGDVQASWKGMRVNTTQVKSESQALENKKSDSDKLLDVLKTPAVFVQIDWQSADVGQIAVDRNNMIVGEQTNQTISWLHQQIDETLAAFFATHSSSVFATFNSCYFDDVNSSPSHMRWLSNTVINGQVSQSWRSVVFPATDFDYGYMDVAEYINNNDIINFVPRMYTFHPSNHNARVKSPLSNVIPDKIVVASEDILEVASVWLCDPHFAETTEVLPMCAFPPEWADMCGLGNNHRYILWNDAHVLVRLWNQEADDWSEIAFEKSLDPLPYKEELLQDCYKASAWLREYIHNLYRHGPYAAIQSLWQSVNERDQEFFVQIWHLIFTSAYTPEHDWTPIYFWATDALYILTPAENIEIEFEDEEWEAYLPEVSEEWLLHVKTFSEKGH